MTSSSSTVTKAVPRFEFLVGDMVHARTLIENDGGVPDAAVGARLTGIGTRGVIVRVGHLEVDPTQTIYVVRFEGEDGLLGPPVGCFPEELTQDPVTEGHV